MKFTTIYLGENKIEVFNTLIGREIIKVNGEIVSQKFSIFGAKHIFSIKENEEPVECKMDFGLGFNGVVFNLYRHDKPVVESPMIGCSFVVILIVIIIAIVLIKDYL